MQSFTRWGVWKAHRQGLMSTVNWQRLVQSCPTVGGQLWTLSKDRQATLQEHHQHCLCLLRALLASKVNSYHKKANVLKIREVEEVKSKVVQAGKTVAMNDRWQSRYLLQRSKVFTVQWQGEKRGKVRQELSDFLISSKKFCSLQENCRNRHTKRNSWYWSPRTPISKKPCIQIVSHSI